MKKVMSLLCAALLAAWMVALPARVAVAEQEDTAVAADAPGDADAEDPDGTEEGEPEPGEQAAEEDSEGEQDAQAPAAEPAGEVPADDEAEEMDGEADPAGDDATEEDGVVLSAQASWGIRCDKVSITGSMQVADSITVNNCTVPAYYAPRESIDESYDGSNVYSCAAFVSRFYRMIFGVNVSNLYPGNWPAVDSGSFSKTDSPKIGDIAAFSGHWAIVRSVSGNEVTLVEQNAFWSYAPNSVAMVRRVIEKGQAIAYYRHSANNLVDPGADRQPVGSLDTCEGGTSTIHVAGWAYDPDTPSASIDVHVYVNGACAKVLNANLQRSDVNNANGISGNHGFDWTFVSTARGSVKVEVFAINNKSDGGNPSIGSKTINVAAPTYRNGTVTDVPTGVSFMLVPRCASRRAVWFSSAGNGTVAVTQGGSNYSFNSNYYFRFVKQSDGTYCIQWVPSPGYYLHVAAEGYLNEWEGCGNSNSKWIPEVTSDGYYSFRNSSYGTYIDVVGAADADGTIVDHYPGNGSNAQKFHLIPVNKSLSDSDVTMTCPSSVPYKGSEAKPYVTVKYMNKTLRQGTDYTVTYKNNDKPGTGTVIITGTGGTPSSIDSEQFHAFHYYGGYYTGSRSMNFTIDPEDNEPPVIESVTVVEDTEEKLVVDVEASDNAGISEILYDTRDIYGNKNVISYIGATREIISDSKQRFTIQYSDKQSGSRPYMNAAIHYGGGADTHRIAFRARDFAGNYSHDASPISWPYVDFDLQMSKHVEMKVGETISFEKVFGEEWAAKYRKGSYTTHHDNASIVEISDDDKTITALSDGVCWLYYSYVGNSIGIMSAKITIEPEVVDLSTSTISSIKNQTYTGKALKPAVTVKVGSTTLKSGTDYTASYRNNTNVGTATVTITGKGNYTGTKTATFKIVAADISGADVSAEGQVYTGSALEPDPTVTLGSATLSSGTDYTVSYKNNTNVGTATVTITGKGNYAGTAEGTFEIARASVSGATVASIAGQTYTGSAIKPTPTVKLGTTTLKSGTDYVVSYRNNTNAGTATVTVTGKGNYTGSVSKTFKISPASVSGATVSSIAEQGYTGSAIKPTPTVKVGSTTLKNDTDYTLSYGNNTKAGTATVTVTGKGNYTGTKSVTFKIVQWAGASRIPVKATAKYTLLKGGYMRVLVGGKKATSNSVVSISGATITGKKAGTATVYLYDKSGKQLQKKTVTVFVAHGKTYEFESSVDKNYVLDIQGRSKSNGAQMIVYKRNGGTNQKYTLYLQSDGTYGIKSVNSGKYLTVEGKTDKYVQQWTWKGGTDQRWRLTVDSANRITFVNVYTNKCFDVQGGKTTNSAKMIVWQSNNGLNQKWKLNQK